MKINIEIDVTPAELRQFLGLPDVAGLQEDMIEYVRGRVARGAENFDPADLLRESTAWGNKTLQRFLSMAATTIGGEEDEQPESENKSRQKSRGSSGGKRGGSAKKNTGTSKGGGRKSG